MSSGKGFFLEIQDVFAPPASREVWVSGNVVRGAITLGSEVEIIGYEPTIRHADLTDIRLLGAIPVHVLDGVTKEQIRRGQVLAAPGTIKPITTFFADVLFDERYEKLTQKPYQKPYMRRYRWSFHIHHGDYFGSLYLPPGKENIVHGDHFTAQIALDYPCALEAGFQFGIGRLLGQGTVVSVIV